MREICGVDRRFLGYDSPQWAELLGARVRESGTLSVFEWPGSPLRISVEIAAAEDEGPVGIEVTRPTAGAPTDTEIDALGSRLLSATSG